MGLTCWIRQIPIPPAPKKWSVPELDYLFTMYYGGEDLDTMAQILGRTTYYSILIKLKMALPEGYRADSSILQSICRPCPKRVKRLDLIDAGLRWRWDLAD